LPEDAPETAWPMTATADMRAERIDPAARRPAPARAEVSADLEAIFGRAPAGAPAARPRPRRRMDPDPGSRAPPLAALGGLAAAACLGVAGGALLMTGTAGTPRSAEPRPTLPVEVAQVAPAAATAPPMDPFATVGAAPAAKPPALHRADAPKRRARSHAAPPRRDAACCAYADVQTADRRLRQAYSAAIRAGVSRPTLVSYRDRWAELRRRHAHEPRRLVTGYGALASDLHQATARALRRPPEQRQRYASRRPWRPRYAPWWS
jgi:hypothetical protein